MDVHWYPGHMARARRQLLQALPLVDVVLEVADARIPRSSRNPDLQSLIAQTPSVLVLARDDLADPRQTALWVERLREEGETVLAADLRQGGWQARALRLLQRVCGKGKGGARTLVVGVPNTGKSTAINALTGRKGTRTGNTPGVTRGPQWLRGRQGLELIDTPGLLWPRLDNDQTRFGLAVTGAIPDRLFDMEAVAGRLLELLEERYPECLRSRYGGGTGEEKIDSEVWLEQIGRTRGTLASGGRVDMVRAAHALIADLRAGRLGRITLEPPLEDPVLLPIGGRG